MKRMMKSCAAAVLALALLLGMMTLLAGCGDTQGGDPAADGTISIVCTNFAGYDLARGMLNTYAENGGEGKVNLILLGKPGQDMHDFEPSASDIITLVAADLVISTGAETWLDAALSSAGNKNAVRVSMMDASDVILEGEHDHDHDTDHEHTHGEEDCSLIGGDEHVWLSLSNALRIQSAILSALCGLDPDHADAWQVSGAAYRAELMALKAAYESMMANAVRKNVVVADRHPFVYLFRELGIECLAAFPGCSSETSASFQTQMALIERTKEWGLSYIFIIEGSDGKVAEVVAGETGAQVLTLNSMQVVTDFENTTYLAVMKQNLENLKKALQ